MSYPLASAIPLLDHVLEPIGGRNAFTNRDREQELFFQDGIHRALVRERINDREPDPILWTALRARQEWLAGKRSATYVADIQVHVDHLYDELWLRYHDDDPAVVTALAVSWSIEAIIAPQFDDGVCVMDLLAKSAGISAFLQATAIMAPPRNHDPGRLRCRLCAWGPDDDASRICRRLTLAYHRGAQSEYRWMRRRVSYRLSEALRREASARAVEVL